MNIKNIAPHIIAVLIFIILNMVMYWPLFMENKVLNQNDVIQGKSANQEINEFREKTGEEALWTNSMFSGMPAYLINTQWSGELLKYIPRTIEKIIPTPASHTFIAMVAFYILLLVFKVNPYLAIGGGLTYGLNSFFLISVEAGHIWKVAAISWMPAVLAGIVLAFRKKYLWAFVLTALTMALEIRSNHLQITYYLLLVVLVFGLFQLINAIKNNTLPDFAKAIGVLTVAVLLGLGANLGKVWTAYEYGQYSIRGKAELSTNTESSGGLDRSYAFAWSNGIWEPFTFMVPNFYGGASQEEVSMTSDLAKGLESRGVNKGQVRSFVKNVPTYWGDQPFTSGPYYMGAVIVFFFILGAIFVKGHIKWWLISASALGIILSWGKNFELFNYFMFDYFPGYNKFRAVSMTVAMPFLCMPLLAFLGLRDIAQANWPAVKKQFLTAVAIEAGLCLLFVLASFLMGFRGDVDAQLGDQAWLIDLIREHRADMFRTDAFRSFAFIIAAAGVLYFWKENRIKKSVAIGLIVGILVVDLVPVSKRYLNDENFVKESRDELVQKTEADKKILQEEGHYRVLNLNNPFNEARTSYYHSSIGGYHGAKMRRYQDLIENHLQGEISQVIERLRSGSTNFSDFSVINMLNTKYIKFGNQAGQVIDNQSANGNAWFVQEVVTASNPDEEIAALSNVDTKQEAVINTNRFELSQNQFTAGSIELVSYKPNELIYESVSKSEGLAVFSEIYYPEGWKAYIDGKEAKILQANYVLRALKIPPGNHKITFEFKPDAYFISNKVMMVCSILILVLFIGGLAYQIKKSI
ncbi:YfhO family protein [Marivirga arenosa]|uniref:YfhO family protein n=1 Tax=Marivirga arenosa TaxID=3059076 RepID=A0AA51RA26_9BACT|nr:YfhO family protein [Marivirga sp. ABR2-2]WMN06398.1 YfhO family protein [Marivirga sp. ABR2-2]